MQLAPIVARLKTQGPALRQLGAAASLEQALDGMQAWPCAFLFAPKAKAAANENLDGVLQRVGDEFGVLTAVRNVTQDSGESALAELDGLLAPIRTALLGWTPGANQEQIEYSGGQLVYAKDGLYLWLDNFTTQHFERA